MKSFLKMVPLVLFFSNCGVSAYTEITHEELTENAYNRSFLKIDETLFEDLGVKQDYAFEASKLSKINIEKDRPKTALYIMRSGATFEDDAPFIESLIIPETALRSYRHFFNPYKDDGNTNLYDREASPLWALEDRDEVSSVNQEYSFRDARDYLYQSLTATSDENRDQSFSMFFRTLGQVVHHIQDMAQPQHVRGDDHLTSEDAIGFEIPYRSDPSHYEKYTGGVTTGDSDVSNRAVDRHLQEQLFAQFSGYEPVILDNARNYWHSEGARNYDGIGLAEFTNREFVSKDTNFGMPDAKHLPSPSYDEDGAIFYRVPDVSQIFSAYGMSVPSICDGAENICEMGFYSLQVTDKLRPSMSGQNSFAVTESIYNDEINKFNEGERCRDAVSMSYDCRKVIDIKFTLNKLNFWSGYPFLLSRAVGYSAGLLNYFFRGRLEVEELAYSGDTVSFKIKNAIDIETYPEWAEETMLAGGELVVAYEYRTLNGDEVRKVTSPIMLAEDIMAGSTSLQTYNFTYHLPEDGVLIREALIYKGTLGQEEENAISIGTFEADVALLAVAERNFIVADRHEIWKSLDYGKSWKVLLSTPNVGPNYDSYVHQLSREELIADVGGSYFYSEDFGNSWQAKTIAEFTQLLHLGGFLEDLDSTSRVVRATSEDVVYLRAGINSSGEGYIYRTPLPGEDKMWRAISSFNTDPSWVDDNASTFSIADLGQNQLLVDFRHGYYGSVQERIFSPDYGASWINRHYSIGGDCNPNSSFYHYGSYTKQMPDANALIGLACDNYVLSKVAISYDLGESWQNEFSFKVTPTQDDATVWQIDYLGKGRIVLYAYSENYSDFCLSDALYFSNDFGVTWTQQANRQCSWSARGIAAGWPGALTSGWDYLYGDSEDVDDVLDQIISISKDIEVIPYLR